MDKKRLARIALLILISALVFLLTYIPHYSYKFPVHIDEWHHITEVARFNNGEYSGSSIGFEFGFHLILLFISKIVNLLFFYRFLPAIWAVFSALALFYVVQRKTKSFQTAVFAMIFFGFIMSNVNLGGTWFFTPLTFSIPFIFLYIYFFTEGLQQENKKMIIAGLAIMVFLLFIHAISVLFAVPFLLVYCWFHRDYIKKEKKFFSWFLIIPLIGLVWYKYFLRLTFYQVLPSIILDLQFAKGWGVVELNNNLFETYTLPAMILAGIGLISLLVLKRDECKKYLAYILWPIFTLAMIIIFKVWGVSYLSPYQRNLYYFTLSLPFLSALGLNWLIILAGRFIDKTKINLQKNKVIKIAALVVIAALTFSLVASEYSKTTKAVYLPLMADEKDYQALLFLANLSQGKVMADFDVASTVYPISGQEPVGTLFFYGNKYAVRDFFNETDCTKKQEMLNKYNTSYIFTKIPQSCDYTLLYSDKDYIYSVKK